MILKFNQELAENYQSNSQKIRVMSENWVVDNVYCVKCGKGLSHFENNRPVGDMYCKSCKEEFELKSNKNILGKQIVDGAYETMIKKIEDESIPNFFYLNYSLKDYIVNNLIIIPKHYFTKEIIIKRPPLKDNTRRAGWIGCNIDVSSIPNNGRLYLVKDGKELKKDDVILKFNKMLFLREQPQKLKKWIFDIMKCIENLKKDRFSLDEIYKFEDSLKRKHPNNNNIQAKIRQQLQILRDNNYIEFIGRGEYKLL